MGLFDFFMGSSKRLDENVKEENQHEGSSVKKVRASVNQMSDLAKRMVEKLKYPHKVFPKGTKYSEIMQAYEESFARGKEEGFTPVLVPADDTLEDFFGIIEKDGYSIEGVLSENISSEEGKRILNKRFKEYRSYAENDFEESLEEFIGVYEDEPEYITSYSAFDEYQTGKTKETILLEVPTKNPWELVAFVPFGGWNECPDMKDMLAICKYWYDKYGAIPVTISHDILEMSVLVPVAEGDAIELAKEHYAFTPDRVDQGTESGTLSEVAECLKVSKIWYFWWD